MKFDVAYRGVTLFFLCLFVIFRFVLQVSSSFSSLLFFLFLFLRWRFGFTTRTMLSSLLSLFHMNPGAESQGWDSCKIKID
jgi:uncharacterized membrane protein